MSLLEILAVLFGIANIALLVLRNVANFPVGMAMVAIYAVVFAGARLYSDALLQVFFFAVQGYGWWYWRESVEMQGTVAVRWLNVRQMLLIGVGCLAATVGWGTAMHRLTNAAFPYLDAFIAALSVAAQLLLARRFIENWIVWILVDLLSIGMYAAKGLYPTMGLYVLFLAMCVWGFIEWRGAPQEEPMRQ